MGKIETLTKEQEAQLAIYRDKWLAIGLSTEKADRKKAEMGIQTAYSSAGLPTVKKIVWCGSPLSSGLTRAIVLNFKKLPASVGDSVGASVGASVGDSVRDSVRDSVGDSVRSNARDEHYRAGYGCHDASWLGFYQYFLEVLKLESCKKLIPLMDFAQEGGWFYPYKNICLISERPTELHLAPNDRGIRVIHRDGGPSIAYADGFSVWALNGVRVPQWLAEKSKHDLTGKEIMGLTNAQQRAEGIKKVGIGALLSDMGAETIDTMDDYNLITIEFEKRRIGPYLQMVNPSTGEIHVEGVGEPTGGVDPKIKTCEQALAWRNQEPKYVKPSILT